MPPVPAFRWNPVDGQKMESWFLMLAEGYNLTIKVTAVFNRKLKALLQLFMPEIGFWGQVRPLNAPSGLPVDT